VRSAAAAAPLLSSAVAAAMTQVTTTDTSSAPVANSLASAPNANKTNLYRKLLTKGIRAVRKRMRHLIVKIMIK
jgi:hypothetical protein